MNTYIYILRTQRVNSCQLPFEINEENIDVVNSDRQRAIFVFTLSNARTLEGISCFSIIYFVIKSLGN